MSRRGRPKHQYLVEFSQPAERIPFDDHLDPWDPSLALSACGDFEWAVKVMCYSPSYLRTLLSANRGSAITNTIVFRNCRVVATMRKV